eukprot:7839417-Pyramimonas_sp.AAC.1
MKLACASWQCILGAWKAHGDCMIGKWKTIAALLAQPFPFPSKFAFAFRSLSLSSHSRLSWRRSGNRPRASAATDHRIIWNNG